MASFAHASAALSVATPSVTSTTGTFSTSFQYTKFADEQRNHVGIVGLDQDVTRDDRARSGLRWGGRNEDGPADRSRQSRFRISDGSQSADTGGLTIAPATSYVMDRGWPSRISSGIG